VLGRRKQTQDLYWFGHNPCLRPVPKQLTVLEISNNLVKSFTSKEPQMMYPSSFSLNIQVDVPSTWSKPQRMYPPLCSLLQPRSYPLLTQNSQTVSSLNSVFGQKILRWLVLWILCLGNQKNSQTVSSLNSFGKRVKEWRRRK